MPDATSRYLRVYLVDDHDIVRQGLLDLLSRAREIRVVGDSGLAARAAASILALGVDVMVLDLQLQDGSGVHVCRQVRAADPSVHGLLLTSADDDQAMAASVLAGAAGFVVKLARSTDIVAAIRRVGAGRTLMDNALRSRTADVLRQRALDLTPRPSARDLQILDRILDGRTDRQVADELGLDLDETQTTSAALADRLLDHA